MSEGYALALSEDELGRYRRMAEVALTHERELWATAGIVDGATVADVGCGPGAVSVVLAGFVGASGRVIGVDAVEGTIDAARAEAERAGVGNTEFRLGDAAATGIEPGSVDVVMMRHVLAHNGGEEQRIVDHLASLVRPGGAVYLVDVDGPGIRQWPVRADLVDMQNRYWAFQQERGNDPYAGLALGDRLTAAGLEVLEHRGYYNMIKMPTPAHRGPPWAARDAMVTAGVADAADVERWNAAYEEIDAGGGPLTVFAPVFCAVGRRAS